MSVDFGVPQGSILGPLLFLIFINDLPKATNFFIRLFADDTFLCSQNNDLMLLENDVNFELQKVYVWLASNKLTLNISKSKFMFFSNKKKVDHILDIKINGKSLEKSNSYKYLGVIFDHDLTWKPHVERICNKISKACGAISKLRHYLDIDTLKSVYFALIHSHIRYGIAVWGNATENVLQPLHALLNRVIRIMTFAPFGIDTKPIFDFLKILDVSQTFSLETGKFVFKSKNNMLPIRTIANHFERRRAVHQHNLRTCNHHSLVTPFVLLSSFKRKSIHYRGMDMWDNIPESIKHSDSFNIFKKSFKTHLFQE